MLGQPFPRIRLHVQLHVLGGELLFQLDQELVDHAGDLGPAQRGERHDGVEAVAEFRREHAADHFQRIGAVVLLGETDRAARGLFRAGIGGHHQDDVAEIGGAAVVVGQLAVVHHLQQQVEDVRMGLLDLVHQHHRVRVLEHRIGEQAALVEADIARRRADQARHGVPLHVFRHVEADQLDAQLVGQLAGDLGLADAGGAGQQEVADRPVRIAQAGARQLDAGGQGLDRIVLAENHQLEVAFQVGQPVAVVVRHALRRDAGDPGDGFLDVAHLHRLAALALGQQAQAGGGLVDDVDGLVRQVAVGDVARRQLHRRADRAAGEVHLVVLLEALAQALDDLDGVLDAGLRHVDLLEAARQRPVLLEDAAVFLVGGAADAAQLAAGQHRLEQVGGVHHAAAGGAGADDHVDLVDEQDRARSAGQLGDDALEALLEVAAVLGAGDQAAEVEAVDHAVAQQLGHAALGDEPGQTFGDGGLAHPGLAHQQRVVLAAPAQGLHHPFQLEGAADQGIDLPAQGALVEIDGELLQRALAAGLARFFLLLGLGGGLRGGRLAVLGDAVRDVVDDIQAADALLVEQVHRMGVLLGEQRHQHVESGHALLAGGLHVVNGALQHALEGQRGLHFLVAGRFLVGMDVLRDIVAQGLFQLVQIGAAGRQNLADIGIG